MNSARGERFGKFVTNARGLDVCIRFNGKACSTTNCHRAHQCSKFLGERPEADCKKRRGKGGKGKGNGDYRKGESSSSQRMGPKASINRWLRSSRPVRLHRGPRCHS